MKPDRPQTRETGFLRQFLQQHQDLGKETRTRETRSPIPTPQSLSENKIAIAHLRTKSDRLI